MTRLWLLTTEAVMQLSYARYDAEHDSTAVPAWAMREFRRGFAVPMRVVVGEREN